MKGKESLKGATFQGLRFEGLEFEAQMEVFKRERFEGLRFEGLEFGRVNGNFQEGKVSTSNAHTHTQK